MAVDEFCIHHSHGRQLLGPNAAVHHVLQAEQPLFHEAGVFFCSETRDELFVTSNRVGTPPAIQIHRLVRHPEHRLAWTAERIEPGDAVMANGATATLDLRGLVFCSQGNLNHPGGLVLMNKTAPHATTPLITSFHGRRFNSPNDVVVARDGSIWFTDPTYGYEQGFRGEPELPSQVYRLDPFRQDVRAMADDLEHPNGLCFSPSESTLYVTDTDYVHGDGTTDPRRASTIYAYTVKSFHGAPFLTERRLFAMADTGAPDGIKCDTSGFVYSGCGDGINVWTPAGSLCLRIRVAGGVANFCFGRPGELLALNECSFAVVQLDSRAQGALQTGYDEAAVRAVQSHQPQSRTPSRSMSLGTGMGHTPCRYTWHAMDLGPRLLAQ